MTPQQIANIQSSFGTIAGDPERIAAKFYARLFDIAPAVRPLFKSDLTEQGRKLMATLSVVVSGLNDMESLLPVAADLAKRHVSYGVRPEHYDQVGAALIDTLAVELGPTFAPEVEEAWVTAYGALSQAMIAAAYPSSH